MIEENQYAERDLMAMDIAGNHYCRHVDHMTGEKLHSKSDIAAELGWRDMQIAELKEQRDALAAENAVIRAGIPEERFIDIMNENMDDVSLAEDIGYNTAVKEMRRDIKTPATDAYLNSVRAEGVDSFGAWLRQSANIFDENGRHEWADKNRVAAEKAKEFAAQLRAGEPS